MFFEGHVGTAKRTDTGLIKVRKINGNKKKKTDVKYEGDPT